MRSASRRLAATVLLAAVLGAASAPAVSAAETVHLYFRTQNGPIRMLGAMHDTMKLEEVSFGIAAAGLPSGTNHRIIGSTRACSKAHVPSAAVFVVRLAPAGSDGALARIDATTPLLAQFDATRSVRLYTNHSGGVQRACAAARPIASFGESDERVVGTHKGTLKGLTLFAYGAGGARVSSIIVGLPPGSVSRLAAVDETCPTAVTSDDIVSYEQVAASTAGVIAVINQPVGAHSLGRENSIECLYVMKGASGHQVRAKAPASVYHTIKWD